MIRQVRPDDLNPLARFFQALSAQSRHRRFLAVVNELPHAVLARFVEGNGVDEVGLVAVLARDGQERVIGEARYAVTGSARKAEFALAVADVAQGIGLGKRLLRALIRHAAANGVSALHGEVLPDNRAMLALTRTFGFVERRDPNDARLRVVERSLISALD